jgi:hypothetical protein
MAADEAKPQAEQSEIENGSRTASSDEKKAQTYLPQSDEDYDVTWKTWIVVWILAWSCKCSVGYNSASKHQLIVP